jgi:hypothetical protein
MQLDTKEDFFYLGFKFALLLTGANDPRVIREKLRGVAQGDVSLMQSADDMRLKIPGIIREYEQVKGSPATEEEKTLLQERLEAAIPKNRQEQDARNRQLATYAMHKMNEEVAKG